MAFRWQLGLISSHPFDVGLIGSSLNGKIELLRDPEKISLALSKTGRDVGILYQDRYWIWVNDPVQFPNGNLGVYGRILSRAGLKGATGCAVVPRFKDGRIALNCNFRHATRSWELEIPRGLREEKETAEMCARREMLEETGFVAKDLLFLGEMAPDTGESNTVASIFLATIEEQLDSTPEDSEAILSIVTLTENALCNGIKNGFLLLEINGVETKVFLRDPFLTYALVQMGIRRYFSFSS